MKTAHVVIINEEGLVLAVSRKDDHTNFGLPGGKMEDEDQNSPVATAFRETKEETGVYPMGLELIFATHMDGKMGFTYLAKDYHGELSTDEPHTIEWVPFQRLINGGFGKYNRLVYDSLKDMGVKVQLDIDEKSLSEEIAGYVDDYFNNSIKFGYLRKIDLYPSGVQYHVYFENSHNYEESFMPLNDFKDGLKTIGEKYGVFVRLTTSYSPK